LLLQVKIATFSMQNLAERYMVVIRKRSREDISLATVPVTTPVSDHFHAPSPAPEPQIQHVALHHQTSSQKLNRCVGCSPLDPRQSTKDICAICYEEHSVAMYYGVCDKTDPISEDALVCIVCYPCLFSGLHLQFVEKRLPHCVVCNILLHQTIYDIILNTLEANFSSSLGERKLDNKLCTCGVLLRIESAGCDAQTAKFPHETGCSFNIIQRMRNQVWV